MTTPKDFSEIQEAAKLLSNLLQSERRAGTPASLKVAHDLSQKTPVLEQVKAASEGFRGDRIDRTLEVMCKRGGLTGAVIADSNGLALAVYNSPVATNAIAAFTSVLGSALEKAGHLLNQSGADNISMDINYSDKVVLRRFNVQGLQYYLMVICPQNIDEREEIELSIEQIIAILS